jgi:hypothetical protein
MSQCGKPIIEKTAGMLGCADGHQFRVRRATPATMTQIDPEHPDDPDHDGKIFPMGEVCPHPDYFQGSDRPVKHTRIV